MWSDRLEDLERDLDRVEVLLEDTLVKQEADLGGRFGLLLGPLKNELGDLRRRMEAGAEATGLWADLTALAESCRTVMAAQLEFLGGVAISRGLAKGSNGFDERLAARTREWLNELRGRVGLDRSLSLIAGRGPILEPETGIVRVPFPDWDLWHLPLLARAVGLLAAEPGSKYRTRLDAFTGTLGLRLSSLLQGDPAQAPPDLALMLPGVGSIWEGFRYAATDTERDIFRQNNRNRLTLVGQQQCANVHHLFADMFATTILGPVYALAVFVLELDYRNPEQHDLEDPDQIEGRETVPRFLPAPAHRAAAILATLQAMDNADQHPAYEQGPYGEVIQRLEALWLDAIQSAGPPDPLGLVRKKFSPWHEVLYGDVIRPLLGIPVKHTQEIWQRAQAWCKALSGKGRIPESFPPDMTELVTAIWLHRLDYPDQAENVARLAGLILEGRGSIVPLTGSRAPLSKVVARARMDRLTRRWKQLEDILRSEQIPEGDRAAVAGRFYRLISEQVYQLEQCSHGLQAGTVRSSLWGKLASLDDGARPLQRETLEFLGGFLVRQRRLDHEPARLTNKRDDGPSICDLADEMLREYARRTGVNWSARTILGTDPFLAMDTQVVRVRFPDWSMWNLPLMAHEFGHLAALATPAFLEFQSEQSQQALEGYPHPERVNPGHYIQFRRRHLDEFFADVFATYTLGPAFVCDVLLLHLNPAEAHVWRGAHPTHHERAQVILLTLGEMNQKTREGNYDEGLYAPLLTSLQHGWDEALRVCQAAPRDEEVFNFQLKQSLRWWRRLYGVVDRFYRLGASYTPKRWRYAQALAQRLTKPPAPTMPELEKMAEDHSLKGTSFCDVLNGVWRARDSGMQPVASLTLAAHQLGRDYLRGLG